MKQYFIKEAYCGNYQVVCLEDRKVVSDEIVAGYALSGVIDSIRNRGYRRAEYVPDTVRKYREAENNYKKAREELQEAFMRPLTISDRDAIRFFPDSFSVEDREKFAYDFYMNKEG